MEFLDNEAQASGTDSTNYEDEQDEKNKYSENCDDSDITDDINLYRQINQEEMRSEQNILPQFLEKYTPKNKKKKKNKKKEKKKKKYAKPPKLLEEIVGVPVVKNPKNYLQQFLKGRNIIKVFPSSDDEDLECKPYSFLNCLSIFLFMRIKVQQSRVNYPDVAFFHDRFNISNVSFPLNLNGVKKIVDNNPQYDLKVNLFTLSLDTTDSKRKRPSLYFLKSFKSGKGKREVNLLAVRDTGPENVIDTKSNFFFFNIKNIDYALNRKYKNGGREKGKFCHDCWLHFRSDERLKKHIERYCEKRGQTFSYCPPVDKKTQKPPSTSFKDFKALSPMEIVGFCDFESSLSAKSRTCPNCNNEICECDNSHSYELDEHKPITCSLAFVDKNNKLIYQDTFSGKDCVMQLLNTLLKHEQPLKSKLQKFKNAAQNDFMSDLQKKCHAKAKKCYLCKKKFYPTGKMQKVADHDHYSGHYLGPCHQICNLNRKTQACSKIPIYVHNLSGYDSHLIMKNIHMSKINDANKTEKDLPKLSALAQNTEKFRSIDFSFYKFQDSMYHFPFSIAKMTTDLVNSNHDFNIVGQSPCFDETNCLDEKEKLKKLFLKKGVFPYSYATSLKALKKTKCIPDRKFFDDTFTGEPISDEDYNHAKEVFEKLKCKNMLEYCEIYCSLDVLLLADAFFAYRMLMIKCFTLDPAFFYGVPSYAFSLMLLKLDSPLEIFSDIEMVKFIRGGIRGGI